MNEKLNSNFTESFDKIMIIGQASAKDDNCNSVLEKPYLFNKIISYVDLAKRMELRLVSKEWRNRIDEKPIKRLFLSQVDEKYVFNDYKSKSEDIENFIKIDSRFLNTIVKSTILNQLKSLTMSYVQLSKSELNTILSVCKKSLIKLNLFGCFIQLSFGYLSYGTLELDLPELISLEIREGLIPKLVLKTPKLIKLKLWLVNISVESVSSKVIRTIELLEFDKFLNKSRFDNLTYLCIGCFYSHQVREDFLRSFKQLKQMHVYSPEVVAILFEQKKKYSLDLSLYHEGLLVTNLNEFSSLFIQLKARPNYDLIEKLVKKNSKFIAAKLPQYREINFSEIEDVWRKLGPKYFRKYVEVVRITVNRKIKDDEDFLEFLRLYFKHLTSLVINKETPSLNLMNKIPNSCPNLQLIKMNGLSQEDVSKFSKYDYSKYHNLLWLSVNNTTFINRLSDVYHFKTNFLTYAL